jgi:uncharacterized protein YjbI with pentapeptide repeats
MNAEQLKEILLRHTLWLKNPEEGCRADLKEADLIGTDLREANLREANLRGADLSRANLIGADLSGAYLIGTDLRGADLSRADLREADLSGANLSRANLIGADLSRSHLGEAKFTVELKDAVNLHAAVYYPQQFAFLALNPSFLESVKSSTG